MECRNGLVCVSSFNTLTVSCCAATLDRAVRREGHYSHQAPTPLDRPRSKHRSPIGSPIEGHIAMDDVAIPLKWRMRQDGQPGWSAGKRSIYFRTPGGREGDGRAADPHRRTADARDP